MALLPCPFLITSNPLIGYPDIATSWHSIRFILARIPISISSFLWQLFSGMPSQKILPLLQVMTHSRQQLVSCSIPSPRSQSSVACPRGPSSAAITPDLYQWQRARLLADDCILYREITSDLNQHLLQQDLDRLASWEKKSGIGEWNFTYRSVVSYVSPGQDLLPDFPLSP